jgi:hypothetical protein
VFHDEKSDMYNLGLPLVGICIKLTI